MYVSSASDEKTLRELREPLENKPGFVLLNCRFGGKLSVPSFPLRQRGANDQLAFAKLGIELDNMYVGLIYRFSRLEVTLIEGNRSGKNNPERTTNSNTHLPQSEF
jgi:hypothetical protein